MDPPWTQVGLQEIEVLDFVLPGESGMETVSLFLCSEKETGGVLSGSMLRGQRRVVCM